MKRFALALFLTACPTLPGIEDAGADASVRPPAPPTRSIAAGATHACAVATDDTLRCWGLFASAPLLDALTPDRRPTIVTNVTVASGKLALGKDFTCAVTANGLQCWGAGALGQLGDGNHTDSNTPLTVMGAPTIVNDLAAGDGHVCERSGTNISCWGDNRSRQLGDGTTDDQKNQPVSVASSLVAVQLDVGKSHSCALRVSGTAVCWGGNDLGQIGDGTRNPQNSPIPVFGGGSGTAVRAGGNSCLHRDDRTVECWGFVSGFPEQLSRLRGLDDAGLPVASLEVGGTHLCAMLSDAGVVCAGQNESGQLGDGTDAGRVLLAPILAIDGTVTQLALGEAFSCALITDGGVWCWGRNNEGQLGDGTNTSRATPAPVRF